MLTKRKPLHSPDFRRRHPAARAFLAPQRPRPVPIAHPKPHICQRCECPIAPHRFIDEWPFNGRTCECKRPLKPLRVARDALHTIAKRRSRTIDIVEREAA